MYEEILVSVIMSVYKESLKVIEQSIKSILNQTHKNIEFIIVQDLPNSNCLSEYLHSIKDERVKIIENYENMGSANCKNKAFKESKGSYICIMDADDISVDYRIERQLNYLITNSLDIVGANVYCVDGDNKIVGKREFSYTSKQISKLISCFNCIVHPTLMMKRCVFSSINGYRNLITEDYDFLLRAKKLGFMIGNCSDFLLFYSIKNINNKEYLVNQELAAQYLSNNYKNIDNIDIEELIKYINNGRNRTNIVKYLQFKEEYQKSPKSLIVALCKNALNPVLYRKIKYKLICQFMRISNIALNE